MPSLARSVRPRDRAPPPESRLAAARAHHAAGRADKAEDILRQLLRKRPREARALHLLGLIARQRGRIGRAVQLLAKAADAAPEAAEIHCDLGLALKDAGRFAEAVARQRHVVALLPDSARALANLGAAYTAWRRPAEAVATLARAAAMAPDDAEIHYNLGNAHLAAADWAAAEAALARAVALDPHHVRARTNLGTALKEQGRLDAAIAALRAAVACAPDDAEAHWNLALALLKAGHYADGWRLYEWRRRLPGFAMRRFDLPAWDGGPLAGRRLVVHAEQGLGDTVQFARYLGDVDPRDGGVVVQVPQTLAPLLAGLRGSAAALRLVGADESLPRCDVEAPLMSLPRLLARPAPFWPATGPYLAAEPDRSARWRDRLAGHDGPTVAICWQGSADYRADARRSIPLRHFAPLAGLERVRLVSLQKGPGRDQRAAQPWRQRLLDLDAEIDRDGAFRDTAAILGCVDLLVTSDTSVAHVAGALGVETWMALADVPDWRWGLEGERTPWYPSLRLFRQSRPGDWDGVFAAIARALAERSR